jgi:hypothetical protein
LQGIISLPLPWQFTLARIFPDSERLRGADSLAQMQKEAASGASQSEKQVSRLRRIAHTPGNSAALEMTDLI